MPRILFFFQSAFSMWMIVDPHYHALTIAPVGWTTAETDSHTMVSVNPNGVVVDPIWERLLVSTWPAVDVVRTDTFNIEDLHRQLPKTRQTMVA